MDLKHTDHKHGPEGTPGGPLSAAGPPASVASDGEASAGLISPPALEYMLLHKKDAQIGRSAMPDAKHQSSNKASSGSSAGAGGGGGGGAGSELELVGYISRLGSTIAVGDLQGQTAPEPDWYRPIEFVCMHCLQPAFGIPIGNPMSLDLSASTGKTTWGLRGRFGSIGCALRYASDNRYSFSQETSGYLPLMLYRVYGFKGDISDVPVAPARTELPPFQPKLAKLWAEGKIQFDGYQFHESMNKGIQLNNPDPQKHYLASDHCAVMVDAQLPRNKLDFKANTLRQIMPNLYTKANNPFKSQ